MPIDQKGQNPTHPNQQGLIQYAITVILLIGIGVAVYLTQFTQVFKPKAQEGSGSSVSTPYGSTPLDQIPLYPKPANGIQTMVYFIFASSTLTPDKPWLNYLGSAIDYVWFDQSSLATCPNATTCTFEDMTNVTNKLKQLNPNIKTGVHAGAAGGAAHYHMIYPFLGEADFLHKTDGTRQFMAYDARVTGINLSSAATRQKIADSWKQIFQANPALTGLNFDSYVAYNGYYPAGCREGDCNSVPFWIPALFDLSSRTIATNPGKDITYNGISYPGGTAYGGEMNILPAAHHNGVLSEWPHEMLVSPAIFRKYLDAVTTLTNQGKKVFFWVQPEVFHYSHGNNFLETNNIAVNLDLERFYLASYLLFQKNPLTYFGYSPLPSLYDGNKGLYWYKDWNLDYGQPLGNWINPTTDFYTRPYANGWAVVNPSTQAKPFTFPAGETYTEWDPSFGPQLSGTITIPARSGKFYFKRKALSAAYTTNFPAQWDAGNPTTFQVTVTNTGTETWKKQIGTSATGRVDLAAYVSPDDDWTHSYTRSQTLVPITSDLAPGQSLTLTVSLLPPNSIPGSYTFRMRMVKQGFAWFDPVYKADFAVVGHAPPSPSPSQSTSGCDRDNQCPAGQTCTQVQCIKAPCNKVCLPTASSSPSPSASVKPGDADGDGDIDIFDFNLVVTNFGKTNDPLTKADLDSDDDVDIFDYNIVVENFGK